MTEAHCYQSPAKLAPTRRGLIKAMGCGCALSLFDFFDSPALATVLSADDLVGDQMRVLPPGAVRLKGFLAPYLQLSLDRWNKGVLPYSALVEFFRSGRPDVLAEMRAMAATLNIEFDFKGDRFELFAAGEMWGKAVRSSALFYRYTGDPELKAMLQKTVADLLTTRRGNGTISCAPVEQQPDGPGGDLWERKYVLLGLDEYYRWVDPDPAVLQAMMDEADATIAQVGPTPRKSIVELGWSPTKIESSTILEPIMRLYNHTKAPRYLEFARYIVATGGAQGHDLFSEILTNDPKDVGGVYPKAYEMLSLFEGLVEYYRVTGDTGARDASLALFSKATAKEITITGNAGGINPIIPLCEAKPGIIPRSNRPTPNSIAQWKPVSGLRG